MEEIGLPTLIPPSCLICELCKLKHPVLYNNLRFFGHILDQIYFVHEIYLWLTEILYYGPFTVTLLTASTFVVHFTHFGLILVAGVSEAEIN